MNTVNPNRPFEFYLYYTVTDKYGDKNYEIDVQTRALTIGDLSLESKLILLKDYVKGAYEIEGLSEVVVRIDGPLQAAVRADIKAIKHGFNKFWTEVKEAYYISATNLQNHYSGYVVTHSDGPKSVIQTSGPFEDRKGAEKFVLNLAQSGKCYTARVQARADFPEPEVDGEHLPYHAFKARADLVDSIKLELYQLLRNPDMQQGAKEMSGYLKDWEEKLNKL